VARQRQHGGSSCTSATSPMSITTLSKCHALFIMPVVWLGGCRHVYPRRRFDPVQRAGQYAFGHGNRSALCIGERRAAARARALITLRLAGALARRWPAKRVVVG